MQRQTVCTSRKPAVVYKALPKAPGEPWRCCRCKMLRQMGQPTPTTGSMLALCRASPGIVGQAPICLQPHIPLSTRTSLIHTCIEASLG